MRILYLLTGERDRLLERISEVQAREHEVTTIDLSGGDVPYDRIVDEILSHDRVISW